VWNARGETEHTITSVLGVFLQVEASAKGHVLAIPGGEQISTQLGRGQSFKETPRPGAPQSFSAQLYLSFDTQPILLDHDAAPRAGTFSPDGSRAVTVDLAGAAYVWEVAARPRRLHKLITSQSPITCAWFSPDGKQLLTRSTDQLTLWNLETGHAMATYPDAAGSLPALGRLNPQVSPFSRDGSWLVSIDLRDDNYLQRWPLNIFSFAQPLAPAELTEAEKARFRLAN
jgi:WD40 repeat protein